jgi:hypothetical protein
MLLTGTPVRAARPVVDAGSASTVSSSVSSGAPRTSHDHRDSIAAGSDPRYDARRMVELVIAAL